METEIQKLYPSATRLIGMKERIMQKIDAGVDVNQRDDRDYTPLQRVAGLSRNFHVVRALVDRGADIDVVDSLGHTPLTTMLFDGVRPGNLQSVLYLIEHGADVNIRCRCGNMSPLEYASRSWVIGRKVIVQCLLEHGAEVNSTCSNAWGWTPLHYAADSGDKEIVQLLLDAGAVSVPDKKGAFPGAYAKGEVQEMFISAKGV